MLQNQETKEINFQLNEKMKQQIKFLKTEISKFKSMKCKYLDEIKLLKCQVNALVVERDDEVRNSFKQGNLYVFLIFV